MMKRILVILVLFFSRFAGAQDDTNPRVTPLDSVICWNNSVLPDGDMLIISVTIPHDKVNVHSDQAKVTESGDYLYFIEPGKISKSVWITVDVIDERFLRDRVIHSRTFELPILGR